MGIVLEKMEELSEIEEELRELKQTVERRDNILNDLESIFPQENNAIAVYNGLTLYWKLGKRRIGDVNLEELERIDGSLIRVIPEKVIPSERKAQTLGKIENWMEFSDANDDTRDAVYKLLNIKQSKSLIMERV